MNRIRCAIMLVCALLVAQQTVSAQDSGFYRQYWAEDEGPVNNARQYRRKNN